MSFNHQRESLSPVRQIPTLTTYIKPIQYIPPQSRVIDPNASIQKSIGAYTSGLNSYTNSVAEGSSPTQYAPRYDDSELGFWRSKYNELENSLCQVNSDLELANIKARKAKENEQKIESLVRRNQQLADECDSVQKVANQKKTQCQIWKSKYETQMNANISQRTNYEKEYRNLQEQLQNLRVTNSQILHAPQVIERIVEVEAPVAPSKPGMPGIIEVEAMQQSHINNISLYDEQLRKLREIIEDREKEIEELKMRVNHHKIEGDSQAFRLSEERDRLRDQISQLELRQQDQLEMLKRRLESNHSEQIRNLNELHRNKINVLEDEISQLKKLFEMKNDEIRTLMNQNKGQKSNFQLENEELRNEINDLKQRIRDLTIEKDDQLRFQSENLRNAHQNEIEVIRLQHDGQVAGLVSEINKLNDIINAKNVEIETQIRENQNQNSLNHQERRRLQAEIDKHLLRYEALERQRDEAIHDAKTKYDRANFEAGDQLAQQTDHIKYLEQEIENLKSLLSQKNEDMQKQVNSFETAKKILEHDLKSSVEQNLELRSLMDEKVNELLMIQDELRNSNSRLNQNSQVQSAELNERINILERERRIINEKLNERENDVKKLLQLKEMLEFENSQLNEDLNEQMMHINLKEQEQIRELEDLRVKLEKNNNEIIHSIKNSHQNQLDVSYARECDLKVHIQNQEREILDLFSQYQNLVAAYSEGKPLTSEISAIKDIFEATAKSQIRNSNKK